MTTLIDLAPLAQAGMAVAFSIGSALFARYAPRALNAAESWIGIKVADQQNDALLTAVRTAAGVIETKIDQGVLSVAHVSIGNDAIAAEAQSILLAAPTLAHSMGLTTDSVAKMIVAAVDTGSRSAAAAPPANAGPSAAAAPQPAGVSDVPTKA